MALDRAALRLPVLTLKGAVGEVGYSRTDASHDYSRLGMGAYPAICKFSSSSLWKKSLVCKAQLLWQKPETTPLQCGVYEMCLTMMNYPQNQSCRVLPRNIWKFWFQLNSRADAFNNDCGIMINFLSPPPTKAIRVQSPAGFSHVEIEPDDAVGRPVTSAISSFPRLLIPVLLHTHINDPHRLSGPPCQEPPPPNLFNHSLMKNHLIYDLFGYFLNILHREPYRKMYNMVQPASGVVSGGGGGVLSWRVQGSSEHAPLSFNNTRPAVLLDVVKLALLTQHCTPVLCEARCLTNFFVDNWLINHESMGQRNAQAKPPSVKPLILQHFSRKTSTCSLAHPAMELQKTMVQSAHSRSVPARCLVNKDNESAGFTSKYKPATELNTGLFRMVVEWEKSAEREKLMYRIGAEGSIKEDLDMFLGNLPPRGLYASTRRINSGCWRSVMNKLTTNYIPDMFNEQRVRRTCKPGKQWYPSFIEESLHNARPHVAGHCPAEIWHVESSEGGALVFIQYAAALIGNTLLLGWLLGLYAPVVEVSVEADSSTPVAVLLCRANTVD
ncbi:hypothetical protein PR048_015354 [Dryococelus australis]|uniref:Uncharacterized protein n=1 Tax=Dryococelus australis TaxID=614101 RepID=A0ABQ9HH02_9NEOP|nr:hypothetical protein PR048_015354 [Dryococelus australis]